MLPLIPPTAKLSPRHIEGKTRSLLSAGAIIFRNNNSINPADYDLWRAKVLNWGEQCYLLYHGQLFSDRPFSQFTTHIRREYESLDYCLRINKRNY